MTSGEERVKMVRWEGASQSRNLRLSEFRVVDFYKFISFQKPVIHDANDIKEALRACEIGGVGVTKRLDGTDSSPDSEWPLSSITVFQRYDRLGSLRIACIPVTFVCHSSVGGAKNSTLASRAANHGNEASVNKTKTTTKTKENHQFPQFRRHGHLPLEDSSQSRWLRRPLFPQKGIL